MGGCGKRSGKNKVEVRKYYLMMCVPPTGSFSHHDWSLNAKHCKECVECVEYPQYLNGVKIFSLSAILHL